MTAKKIIIDTDSGIDDALALKIALYYFKNRFSSITVVGGNIPLEKAVKNAGLLISLYEREKNFRKISLHRGSSKPLKGSHFPFAYEYHSSDGLGGLLETIEKAAGEKKLKLSSVRAWNAIVQMADKEKTNTLTLITIGPLTNIANAILKCPGIMRKLKEIIIMGGSFNYSGNITSLAEFNIYCDPFAASVVFSSEIPYKSNRAQYN